MKYLMQKSTQKVRLFKAGQWVRRSWNYLKECQLIMSYRNGNHYLLNVSSLPNTLNNRINIQITMTDGQQFTLKQIVWAKVSDYPWWPARIVKTLAQRSRKIYRVHFFGDPTYCYLQSQQLLDFEIGLTSLPEGNSIDLILKKSIQLAKAASKKNKIDSMASSQLYQCSAELQPIMADSFEETKLQSKLIIENVEKIEVQEKYETDVGLQKTESTFSHQNITIDNVIQHLMDANYLTIKSTKGYNNRKQALELQTHLKQLLLTKYHLRHIPKAPLDKNIVTKKQKIPRKSQGFKHRLIKKSNHKKEDMIHHSAKKLYKMIAKNRRSFPSMTHESVSRIIEAINHSSCHSIQKYARTYMKVTRWVREIAEAVELREIENCDLQRTLIQRIHNSQFQNFNNTLDQDLKKQDQEKSKVTQIEACSV